MLQCYVLTERCARDHPSTQDYRRRGRVCWANTLVAKFETRAQSRLQSRRSEIEVSQGGGVDWEDAEGAKESEEAAEFAQTSSVRNAVAEAGTRTADLLEE